MLIQRIFLIPIWNKNILQLPLNIKMEETIQCWSNRLLGVGTANQIMSGSIIDPNSSSP